MGQAASHPAYSFITARSTPHQRGGSRRTGLITALFSGLFVSGLFLWLWPQDSAVLWLHLLGGVGLLAMLGPWIARHVRGGLIKSKRPRFTQLSWALLAVWLGLILSGITMALPALFWAFGFVFFPAREVSDTLSLVHFWASWIGMAGLILHLGLRHWVWGPK